MTSCRTLFHNFLFSYNLLSSLFPSSLLSFYLPVIKITSSNTFFPHLSLSCPLVLLLRSIRAKQKCFPTICPRTQKICSYEDKDVLFLLYVRSSSFYLSLFIYLSLLSPLSSFSSSFSGLCHAPLSPFHISICWPTGSVTDRALWAAWKVFVNNIGALLNSVCGF